MQKKFISIHKLPASIRFAPIKYALTVTVEPFKFSPAEPVAYELSQSEKMVHEEKIAQLLGSG